MKCFAVYDVKVEAYVHQFLAKTVGEGLRMFIDTVRQPKSQMSVHPEDFTLFETGEWSEETADYINLMPNKPLGGAMEYVNIGEGE